MSSRARAHHALVVLASLLAVATLAPAQRRERPTDRRPGTPIQGIGPIVVPGLPAPGPVAQKRRVRPPVPTPPPALGITPRCTAMTTSGEVMQVTLHAPVPGTTFIGYEPNCPPNVVVDGTATVGLLLSDFYFIIDSSGSTGRCTGSDIDGDGIVGMPDPFLGFNCDDQDDTVLAAELKAVRDFVATLSPAVSRVSIIMFSMPEGAGGLGEHQRILNDLTNDFSTVNASLDQIAAFGPAGATDYGGALDLLIAEYTGFADPANRRQFCYFLSDGVPTYPDGTFGTEDPGDSDWALDHAEMAAGANIKIHTFGVGFIPSVTLDPTLPRRCVRPDGTIDVSTLECMALLTGGTFFASTNPADIVDRIRLSQPAGIESVTIYNDTNGTSVVAPHTPDGTFAASIDIVLNVINELRVVVVADDGTTCVLNTDYFATCYALAAGCAPLTQGYWHRQCMGLGLIPPNGNGGGPPPHPDWDPQVLLRIMLTVVDPQVVALGSPPDQTTCQGLDADPQDDMCQKAIKQYTAVLMNQAGGLLGPSCVIDLPDMGLVGTDPQTAAAAIAAAIQAGLAGDPTACQKANDAADLINTAAAVR